eukprot:COSAG05_NODE_1174_length_5617_cov_33.367162_2_plen_384_part_00
MVPAGLLALALLRQVESGIPPTNIPPPLPPWAATWNMSLSTIAMPCNASGWFSAKIGGSYGLVSYDWSNAKALWANAKPMDAEVRMVTQAAATKQANPDGHVWVYRNLVKALPWFESVRAKLLDPAYSSWFLKFDPAKKGKYSVHTGSPNISAQCDLNYEPPICSDFYHDQEQTPAHGEAKPDGNCIDKCDCGPGLPCGEYLFDHRNGSMLQDWLVNEYILGPNAVGNVNITGVFIDDFWCYGSSCTDPVAGASEIDKYQQVDMGLSDAEIKDISIGWRANMEAVHKALIKHKAFAWDLFPNQHDAGCGAGPEISKSSCHAILSHQCASAAEDDNDAATNAAPKVSPLYREQALYYGLTKGNLAAPTVAERLPDLAQDLANFL